MAVSRRRFIKTSAVLGLIAGAPAVVFASSPSRCDGTQITSARGEAAASGLERMGIAEADALASLTQESFMRQLNTRFELLRNGDSESIPVVLSGIFDHKAQCGHASTSRITLESFSLSFSCAQPTDLSQAMYTLRHAELGSFALLLVPAGQDGKAYEAVINRLHI